MGTGQDQERLACSYLRAAGDSACWLQVAGREGQRCLGLGDKFVHPPAGSVDFPRITDWVGSCAGVIPNPKPRQDGGEGAQLATEICLHPTRGEAASCERCGPLYADRG